MLNRTIDTYIFTLANGKTITFTVNDPTAPVVGVSGKPLRTKPKQLAGLANYIYDNKDDFNGAAREVIDRVVSMWPDQVKNFNPMHEDWDFLLKNWKILVKMIRENESKFFPANLSTDWTYFVHKHFFLEIVAKRLPGCRNEFLEEIFKYARQLEVPLTNDLVVYNSLKLLRRAMESEKLLTLAKQNNMVEVLAKLCYGRVVFGAGNSEERVIQSIRYHLRDEIYEQFSRFEDLVNNCKILGTELPKKGTIRDLCRETEQKVEAIRNAEASKAFGEFQSAAPLKFEDEDYEIFVPTTYDEAADVGEHFHNCFGGYEWNTYLKNHQRYGVVVIEKATNTRVVCVDIIVRTGKICQYLAKYNNSVTDEKLLAFKEKYQQYLSTVL